MSIRTLLRTHCAYHGLWLSTAQQKTLEIVKVLPGLKLYDYVNSRFFLGPAGVCDAASHGQQSLEGQSEMKTSQDTGSEGVKGNPCYG